MASSALFIINKFSGGGYRPDLEGRIIETCRKAAVECRIEFTQKRGHATELAQWAVDQRMDIAFAVGGDGTVNEVAQGLVHTDVAMGILPKGSGNGLARHLRIPMAIRSAMKIITDHRILSIDTLTVNEKLSVNVSGIGFDGQVALLFAGKAKRGLAGYAKLVLEEFRRFKEFEAQVTVGENQHTTKAFIIALANSSQFGNNARVAPNASVQDQLLDISVVRKVPLIHALGFTQKMFTGKLHRSRFVTIHQHEQAKIQLNEPVAYHIDGEAMSPVSSFEVSVNPRSLKMLVPSAGAHLV